ncbi:MAG: CPBP family intramembrane glutamic endopeptidase [archaeon]
MFYELLVAFFILGPLFYLRVVKQHSWEKIREEMLPKFGGPAKEIIGSITLFGALLIGFYLLMVGMTTFEYYSGATVNDLGKVEQIVKEDFAAASLPYLATILIVLFAEEFFFRAFLVPRVGIILSTIVFTAFHIGYGSIAEIIGVFFLGLILAYWFKKNKSLFQNYLGHVIYDAFAIALYLIG